MVTRMSRPCKKQGPPFRLIVDCDERNGSPRALTPSLPLNHLLSISRRTLPWMFFQSIYLHYEPSAYLSPFFKYNNLVDDQGNSRAFSQLSLPVNRFLLPIHRFLCNGPMTNDVKLFVK